MVTVRDNASSSTVIAIRNGRGPKSWTRLASATAPASSASPVRNQARNVRSLASVNR